MTKYGSDDLVIMFDNTGSTPVDMTQYILEMNGIDIEAIIEEAHTFGDSWVEQLFSGLKRANEITFKGFYDDTVTVGPDVIFNAIGDTRTLTITWGGSKTTGMDTVIKNYRRLPARGETHKFEVVLSPTGAVNEDA